MSYTTSKRFGNNIQYDNYSSALSDIDNIRENQLVRIIASEGLWGSNNRRRRGFYRKINDELVLQSNSEIPTPTNAELTAKIVTEPRLMSPANIHYAMYNMEIISSGTDFNTIRRAGDYYGTADLSSMVNTPDVSDNADAWRVEVRHSNDASRSFVTQKIILMDPDNTDNYNDEYTRALQYSAATGSDTSAVTKWRRTLTDDDLAFFETEVADLDEQLSASDERIEKLEDALIDELSDSVSVYQGRVYQNEIYYLSAHFPEGISIDSMNSDDHLLICLCACLDRSSFQGAWSRYKDWKLMWTQNSRGSISNELIIEPREWAYRGSFDGAWVFTVPRSSFSSTPRQIALKTANNLGSSQYRYVFTAHIIRGYDMERSQFFATANSHDSLGTQTEPLYTNRVRHIGCALANNPSSSSFFAYQNNSAGSFGALEQNWRTSSINVGNINRRGTKQNVGINETGSNIGADFRGMFAGAFLVPRTV